MILSVTYKLAGFPQNFTNMTMLLLFQDYSKDSDSSFVKRGKGSYTTALQMIILSKIVYGNLTNGNLTNQVF